MSKEFKKTLYEKYGLPGTKGQAGEDFFEQFYTKKGYRVIKTDKHILHQKNGIDFFIVTIKGSYTIDVKNNLTLNDEVVIEMDKQGWLFNPIKISQFISHINTSTKTIASYRRQTMIEYLNDNFWDYRNELLYLNINKVPFIKVEKELL